MHPPKTAILLLAAGESSRLGEPKQLLDVDGEPLIRRVVRQLLSLHADGIAVVVGAHRQRVVSALEALPVTIIVNEAFSQGIGTSIVAGIAWAKAEAPITHAMIVLCDQPAIDSDHFKAMLERATQADAIIATAYADTLGVPAIFPRSVFDRLLALPPEEGAKRFLNDPAIAVESVACETAQFDLDTAEDVARWRKRP